MMSILSRIIAILVGIALIYVVMKTLKKQQISAAMSLLWIFSGILIIVLGIFPSILPWAAALFDVSYPPVILLSGAIVILGFITFKHAKEISLLRAQITELTQQLSVLKHELEKKDIL